MSTKKKSQQPAKTVAQRVSASRARALEQGSIRMDLILAPEAGKALIALTKAWDNKSKTAVISSLIIRAWEECKKNKRVIDSINGLCREAAKKS